jgi:glycosyltransferase involved in cell wall biosynthesis
MSKPRVLYVLVQYPQLSETYIRAEILEVRDAFELSIVSMIPADVPYEQDHPFRLAATREEIQAEIDRFRPDLIHTHWLHNQLALVAELSRTNGIPFTVRSHSFDTLFTVPAVPGQLARNVDALNGGLCLGVLALPFAVPRLIAAGVGAAKITSVYPAVRYADFLNRAPNGDAVISVGASLPKKQFEDFVTIAASLPELDFNLYAIGYESPQLRAFNEAHGSPVNVLAPVRPEAMPAVYKRHRWLVVTASREIGKVGWPLCIAEAQASGVGVCVPRLRDDLHEYVGEAGFFYDTPDEVREIVSRPYPDAMREAGFEQARKSDIASHNRVLTALWEGALSAA